MITKKKNYLQLANYIAIAIPFVCLLGGIYDLGFIYLAFLSLVITGLMQLIIAGIFWYQHPENNSIKIYLALVAFFFYMFIFVKAYDFYWIMPFALCIYLTSILRQKPFFNYNFH